MSPGTARGLPTGIEQVIGDRWALISDLTHPWATTRSILVATSGGPAGVGRLVVQWGSDRAAIARRMRLGRRLADIAPGLPFPRIIGGDARAPVPFLVSTFVEGRGGQLMLGSNRQAATLGRLAGAISRDVAALDPTGLRLSRRWADPDHLGVAVGDWAARPRSGLDGPLLHRVLDLAQRVPEVIGRAPPVFAHGDLVPVNVVVANGRIAGLLDLEHARLAHPLHDAAWWNAIIGAHHPDRVGSAVGAFLEAAGIPHDDTTLTRLRCLAACQSLERIVGLPASAQAARRAWIVRLAGILDGSIGVGGHRR